MNDTTYNGHKNYDFWNAALWILNEECLYRTARSYSLIDFREFVYEVMPTTPDGVLMSEDLIDYAYECANDE